MRGHIIQRSPGSYSIKIELDKDAVTGKRRQKWITVKGSHNDAKKKLTQLLHELDTGTFIIPGKVTVAEYLSQWLDGSVRSTVSPKTHELYSYLCRKHLIPNLGNTPCVLYALSIFKSSMRINCKASVLALSNYSMLHSVKPSTMPLKLAFCPILPSLPLTVPK